MNKLMLWIRKYQIVRILTNILFLYIFIQMAYQNLRNLSNGNPDFNKNFVLHQIVITFLFYGTIYFTLFYFSYNFLFKKKVTQFYVYTFLALCIGGFLITLYHQYLLNHFPSNYHFILVPIDLNVDFKVNSFLVNLSENYLKMVPLYLMLALSFFARHFFIEQRTKELLQQKQTESELAQLKSQINPHFLFNVLNSIYSLAIKQSDKTPDIVMRLSDLLRYMLYESKTEAILLSKEIQILTDYLEIEKIRLLPEQSILMQCEGEIREQKIAPLLFLPFAENAVKYGLDSMTGDGYVLIQIKSSHNKCLFICENTFKENMNKNIEQSRGGIGIENVTKRLSLLYPNKHKLSIQKDANLFKVELEIQL